jgi:hypothetical protein
VRRGEDTRAGAVIFGSNLEFKHEDDCKREPGGFGNSASFSARD